MPPVHSRHRLQGGGTLHLIQHNKPWSPRSRPEWHAALIAPGAPAVDAWSSSRRYAVRAAINAYRLQAADPRYYTGDEPWRVRACKLPLFWRLYLPQRTAPRTYASDASEEALHRASWQNRLMEDTPPLVRLVPLGTWAIDAHGSLYQLRSLWLGGLYATEAPYTWLVDKYVGWIEEGHMPPPIRVVETRNALKITDGHHRVAALRQAGREVGLAWVSVGYGQSKLQDLTHQQAVLDAVAADLPVPDEVLADYSGLITVTEFWT